MIAWYWGLINALLVSIVILLNGYGRRIGWAAGVAAQAWIIAFGLTHSAWTFAFSVIPLGMFAFNWWRHPVRERQREAAARRKYAPLLVDVGGTSSMLMMTREDFEGVVQAFTKDCPPGETRSVHLTPHPHRPYAGWPLTDPPLTGPPAGWSTPDTGAVPSGLISKLPPPTDEELAEFKKKWDERMQKADSMIEKGVRILPAPPKHATFEIPKDEGL
jgi:hypothetical protein